MNYPQHPHGDSVYSTDGVWIAYDEDGDVVLHRTEIDALRYAVEHDGMRAIRVPFGENVHEWIAKARKSWAAANSPTRSRRIDRHGEPLADGEDEPRHPAAPHPATVQGGPITRTDTDPRNWQAQ